MIENSSGMYEGLNKGNKSNNTTGKFAKDLRCFREETEGSIDLWKECWAHGQSQAGTTTNPLVLMLERSNGVEPDLKHLLHHPAHNASLCHCLCLAAIGFEMNS